MNWIALALTDFNREYLRSRADRRRTLHNLLCAGVWLALLALLAVTALLRYPYP